MSAVSKQFPGVTALDRVDFHVAAGEIVGLVGENGAGKSTLMKILGGIHQADSGTIALEGLPEVRPGDDLASLILDAASRQGLGFEAGDVLVVTQKVVSKAEDRIVELDTVEPGAFARQIAEQWEKDARVVELVLGESARIVRMDHGVLICETRHGLICANAGMAPHNFEGTLLLLGDIYAKGGRLDAARQWYAVGQASGRTNGYRYQAVADDRVANAADRVALYADGDPTNDPPLLGGGGGSCPYCHEK